MGGDAHPAVTEDRGRTGVSSGGKGPANEARGQAIVVTVAERCAIPEIAGCGCGGIEANPRERRGALEPAFRDVLAVLIGIPVNASVRADAIATEVQACSVAFRGILATVPETSQCRWG